MPSNRITIEVFDKYNGKVVKVVDITGQSQKRIDRMEELLYDEYPFSRYSIIRKDQLIGGSR